MRWFVLSLACAALFLGATLGWSQPAPRRAVLVIHGGAGAIAKGKRAPALEKQYRDDLERALRTGYAAMKRDGGTSLDAVEAAIKVMEDSPLFNAGKGAVFNREGQVELNAAIMDGDGRRAGAVAGVNRIRNSIAAARLVMAKSDHVFLIGTGAERFARAHGLAEVTPLYFWTERRWQELLDAQEKERTKQTGVAAPDYSGTVGAVAVDRAGNLAAGTSTGGILNKLPGRVGDSPLIGAGTYADNAACAVSCTGHGELFIRHAVAHDVAARMKYKKLSVTDAANETFRDLPKAPRPGGGVGGLIALDKDGHFATPYNTTAMPRGYVTADGKVHVAIEKE
jgi:beta-aspartyl-peptidase (threonine type)